MIVGAGISGLYCAWRLLESGLHPENIELFEADGSAGGRIRTVPWPGDDNLRLDLGARYLNIGHSLTVRLLERLEMDVAGGAADGLQARKDKLLHLRGVSRTERDVRRSWLRKPFPYDVPLRWQRRNPRHLVDALRKTCEASEDLARRPLPAVVEAVLGGEGRDYLGDRLGYSFLTRPLNAKVTLDWMGKELFRGTYRRPAAGMSTLTDRLTEELARRGLTVRCGCRLADIEFRSGRATLAFLTQDGSAFPVEADRTVLTVPPSAIASIPGLSNFPSIRKLVRSVEAWPIVTAAMIYAEQWWRGLAYDRVLTDLPVGSLDFVSQAGSPHGAVTVYAEGDKGSYWRGMTGALPASRFGRDHPILPEMHRQVAGIFEPLLGRNLPAPIDLVFMDWRQPAFGGAFHLWGLDSDPAKMMELASLPLEEHALHLCGEAWSRRQGWIEGGLESVELLLQRHFGLEPPSSLSGA